MKTDEEKAWSEAYSKWRMAYPSEYVIRIFRGSYPKLNLKKDTFAGKKICDVSCGDGRNMPLFKGLGFDLYGSEITDEIADSVRSNLSGCGITADIRTGKNDSLPFENDFFDYAVSWNVVYYMGKELVFEKHVEELARILKKEGYLILSIPKKSCFIYDSCEKQDGGYCKIKNDPFNLRNGTIMRMFEDEMEIEKAFSQHFKDFAHGSIHDDCFGYRYHWHLLVCRKK